MIIKNRYTEKVLHVFNGQQSLTRVCLSGGKLPCANLNSMDLSHSNFRAADLTGADLTDANLTKTDLVRANLYSADLFNANLSGADLRSSNLSEADLKGAILDDVKIINAIGNGHQIRSISNAPYNIVWTKNQLAIGCKQKSFEEWEELTVEKINIMDPPYSLKFFKEQWPLIKKFVYATREEMQ